jgi:hypothetical protein
MAKIPAKERMMMKIRLPTTVFIKGILPHTLHETDLQ